MNSLSLEKLRLLGGCEVCFQTFIWKVHSKAGWRSASPGELSNQCLCGFWKSTTCTRWVGKHSLLVSRDVEVIVPASLVMRMKMDWNLKSLMRQISPTKEWTVRFFISCYSKELICSLYVSEFLCWVSCILCITKGLLQLQLHQGMRLAGSSFSLFLLFIETFYILFRIEFNHLLYI